MNYLINKLIFLVRDNKSTTVAALVFAGNLLLKAAGITLESSALQTVIDGAIDLLAFVALLLARDPNNTASPTVSLTGSAFEDK